MTTVPFVRQLELGSIGPDVTAVKRALVKWNKNVSDGVVANLDHPALDKLGAQAVALLKRFQGFSKVTVDGVYGPGTHAKLAPFFDEYGQSLLEKEHEALTLYRDPFRDIEGISFEGYDQGVDFAGAGPVYAAGPGEIVVSTTTSGWPGGGAVCYRITAGVAAGKTVYLTEHITPLVKVGDKVTSETPIATLHEGYPDCETGWSEDGTDNPLAQPIAHVGTYYGVNFGAFLRMCGNKHCPVEEPQTGSPLPAGWPSWEEV